jgi:hypothetical protein
MIAVNAGSVYAFVMGIVLSGYLETALSLGLTRRQNTRALLLVSAALAGALCIFGILGALAFAKPVDPLRFLGIFALDWSLYMSGWLIAIGYQYRRFITAVLSTTFGVLAAIILISLGMSWDALGWVMGISQISQELPLHGVPLQLLVCALMLALSALLAVATTLFSRRIPIKV